MRQPCSRLVALTTLVLLTSGLSAAPLAVRELRVQQAGEVTYFHVQFDTPKRMMPGGEARLIPQDSEASHVCRRADPRGGGAVPLGMDGGVPVRAGESLVPRLPGGETLPDPKDAPRRPVPVLGLEFVGRVHGKGEAKFILLYPTEGRPSPLGRFGRPAVRAGSRVRWAEAPAVLDFAKAKKVAVPVEAKERKAPPAAKPSKKHAHQPGPQWPVRDDLEGLWAVAQIHEFGRLQSEVSNFGFYGFAIQTTGRKYRVPVRPDLTWPDGITARGRGGSLIDQQMYETTTGAIAIAESLQLRRLLGWNFRDTGKRTIPLDKIEGITVAEHPWKKMMGDRKPAPEPMAKFIPDDNYYVHFKNVRQLIDFTDLLDQWGTSLIRAYELHSRDYRLKERYQQQLCIKSTALGKKLGPLVLRGLAVTGSDAYLREGSDVAIIFQVANRALFLAAVQPFIEEARTKFGDRLKETKTKKGGLEVESFVTPLREVSLHRATVGDYVIYANSPVGLQRILDTYQGKHKALAEALDFQYMRTIFRYDDKDEAGFAYLSDAFIRQLVGPASKIKEKRRLEALTSLYMLTEGALYSAWETGRLPTDRKVLLTTAGLKEEEVYVPEGGAVAWNDPQQVAVAGAYNTIHFATPLIELPIDKATEAEAQSYRRFRLEYLGLWRRYFDPIGMRIALDDKRVKLDTYILPLVANSQYNGLRRLTGNGVVRLDLGGISPNTIMQFMMHLSPTVGGRRALLGLDGPLGNDSLLEMLTWGLDPMGKWFLVRADDSPAYGKIADLLEDEQLDTGELARQLFRVPVMVGMDVQNRLTFAGAVAALRLNVMKALPGAVTWEPFEKPYKDVTIVRVQATPRGMRAAAREIPQWSESKDAFLPALYYAMIDGGFYLTPNEAMLRDFIDRTRAKREGKAKTVEANSSLYISPGAAKLTRGLVQKLLERQVHNQALSRSTN